ncbi:MAG TPA: hypothetical protein VJ598_12180 [Albitalea sp.]|nr:hypothetical protein [Albitalea sp.]
MNGRTATLCWKCDADLATPDLLEPAPKPRPAPTTSGGWWSGPPAAAAESPQPSTPPPPEVPPPAAPPAPVSADTPAPTPQEAPASTLPPEGEAAAPIAIWAFADSTSFADHAETLRRHSRKVVSSAMVAVAAALAVAAYFLFRPAVVGDAGWHVTAPAVALQPPHRAASGPVDNVPTGLVASPPPKPEPSVAAPATSTLVRPAPVRRDASRGKAGDEEPPPHPGPCTPQIAALGLCNPEPKP